MLVSLYGFVPYGYPYSILNGSILLTHMSKRVLLSQLSFLNRIRGDQWSMFFGKKSRFA